jgi:hypothetical protein
MTLLDQKTALEDEIWFLAIAENFAKVNRTGIARRYGIRELRKRRERRAGFFSSSALIHLVLTAPFSGSSPWL